MAFKYCQCGGKTSYSLTIPKFCAECGKNFSELFAGTKPSEKKKIVLPKYEEPEDEIEEDDYEEEDIPKRYRNNNSSFSIEAEVQPAIYAQNLPKFKDVFATEKPTPREPHKKLKINKKQALEEIKKRATPSRTPIDIE